MVTAAVISFVWKARPEVLEMAPAGSPTTGVSMRRLLIGLAAVALVTGAVFSWFASANPTAWSGR